MIQSKGFPVGSHGSSSNSNVPSARLCVIFRVIPSCHELSHGTSGNEDKTWDGAPGPCWTAGLPLNSRLLPVLQWGLPVQPGFSAGPAPEAGFVLPREMQPKEWAPSAESLKKSEGRTEI